ncbi:hypothetical protein SY89_00205 [Halolamina pelagica]|uniref:Universal stress protein family protein n=1 Tax=Halolamina pelagica TaxID=699431 RepID=A0A0P7GVD1_9EURY|nr:hypothetical protein [Halolamina pelagica]KPN29492.1 hypothetical protein SY89_00205 [Halolamina pelagica]
MPETPHVIVPVAVLEGEVVPDPLVEFLSSAPVVVLGYHRIPEQTTPEQAREEFGERANRELETLTEAFEAGAATVESRLAFTHDVAQTIQRVVEEVDRGVVLRPNPVQHVDTVFVGVRNSTLVPAITATVATLVGPTDAELSLRRLQGGAGDGQLLAGMETALQEAGITDDRITVDSREAVSIGDAVETISEEQDLVILGEDDPSILNVVWEPTPERVAERTLAPVLVVQRPFENE